MIQQTIEAGASLSRIRPAEQRDVPRLLEMVTALAEHHGDIPTPSARALKRDLFGPTACARALVAERGGRVVGYALLACFPQAHTGLRIMELHHLHVDDAHRGTGIGRHLVAAVVEEARRQECGRMTVSTRPENRRAQGLYMSLGFRARPAPGPRFQLDLPACGDLPDGWV